MIELPDWSHRSDYITVKHGVTPDQANQAYADQSAAVFSPDPASKSGESDRTIGWSQDARAIVTVITVRHKGHLWGINAWLSNARDQRIYREE